MNEIVTTNIDNLIYEIRGVQVMLDSDLARLYNCKNGTKTINLAVKRHINRFPERFMFQLTREEYYKILRFQSETLELEQGKYNKYLPFAFTEQGVAMLASVLRTDIAEEMSIKIMDAFVAMRHYIGNNVLRLSNVETKVIEHDNRLKLVEETLDSFKSDIKVNQVFYNGQIYDAYSCLVDILNKAREDIIIIDNYADKSVLDMISKIEKDITLILKDKSLLTKQDIDKYNKQYNNLEIIYNNDFHDRFIIIDKSIVYHLGSSINHAGNKIFGINIIEDKKVKEDLISRIVEIVNTK